MGGAGGPRAQEHAAPAMGVDVAHTPRDGWVQLAKFLPSTVPLVSLRGSGYAIGGSLSRLLASLRVAGTDARHRVKVVCCCQAASSGAGVAVPAEATVRRWVTVFRDAWAGVCRGPRSCTASAGVASLVFAARCRCVSRLVGDVRARVRVGGNAPGQTDVSPWGPRKRPSTDGPGSVRREGSGADGHVACGPIGKAGTAHGRGVTP